MPRVPTWLPASRLLYAFSWYGMGAFVLSRERGVRIYARQDTASHSLQGRQFMACSKLTSFQSAALETFRPVLSAT
jgi:hypothetical protein